MPQVFFSLKELKHRSRGQRPPVSDPKCPLPCKGNTKCPSTPDGAFVIAKLVFPEISRHLLYIKKILVMLFLVEELLTICLPGCVALTGQRVFGGHYRGRCPRLRCRRPFRPMGGRRGRLRSRRAPARLNGIKGWNASSAPVRACAGAPAPPEGGVRRAADSALQGNSLGDSTPEEFSTMWAFHGALNLRLEDWIRELLHFFVTIFRISYKSAFAKREFVSANQSLASFILIYFHVDKHDPINPCTAKDTKLL